MISNSRFKEPLVEQAVNYLKQGKLVAFPTETVYGLGADAKNIDAIKRLYKAKGRPEGHPVIVHLSDINQLPQWTNSNLISKSAEILAKSFWPGPLTLILPKTNNVLLEITGGQNSVGIRIPRHPIAQALLKAFGSGLAAPSANKFGKLSTTSAKDVSAEFGHEIAMVLDGGFCDVGIESTIVDCTQENIKILRPGIISITEITQALANYNLENTILSADTVGTTKAPGNLASHYAPQTPTIVLPVDRLLERLNLEENSGKKIAVLALSPLNIGQTHLIVAPNDAHKYARALYSNLRELDKLKADLILVEEVPHNEMWAGIVDRLTRASYVVQ
jgi:L-threonylcarbamoyladenylate synthase